jgi:hypothetical protein
MRALSTAEWLKIWETGLAQRPAEWVLTLLAAACPELAGEALAQLSLGQRDAYVLALRESLFGSPVASLATCPACSEQLELAFDVADIRAAISPVPAAAGALQIDDWTIDFHLPNSLDLLAVGISEELETALALLRRRCILAARRGGKTLSAERWPEQLIQAVIEHMAQIDPLADVQLLVVCPACGHSWPADFDIVRFLWNELDAWAIQTLRDVHQMAAAYGWREDDILALSPWRRQVYLELIG